MSELPTYLDEIRTPNLWGILRPVFLDYIEQFKCYPELEGIVALGGVADTSGRRFLDRYSDLDASIFISLLLPSNAQCMSVRDFINHNQDLLPDWLPPFEVHLPCYQHPDREVEINIHQQIIELEQRPELIWDEMRKEAYAETGEIIFDRSGRLKKLIREKTEWDDIEARRELLKVLGQAYWYGTINPFRQLKRGFPHNSHDLLNESIDLLVQAVYLINRKYRPHKKWRLQRTFYLPTLPSEFKGRILEALIVPSNLEYCVESRVRMIQSLLNDVTLLAGKVYDLPENCYEASCVESFDDRQLKRI